MSPQNAAHDRDLAGSGTLAELSLDLPAVTVTASVSLTGANGGTPLAAWLSRLYISVVDGATNVDYYTVSYSSGTQTTVGSAVDGRTITAGSLTVDCTMPVEVQLWAQLGPISGPAQGRHLLSSAVLGTCSGPSQSITVPTAVISLLSGKFAAPAALPGEASSVATLAGLPVVLMGEARTQALLAEAGGTSPLSYAASLVLGETTVAQDGSFQLYVPQGEP